MDVKKIEQLKKLVGIQLPVAKKYMEKKFPITISSKRYNSRTSNGKIVEDMITMFVEGIMPNGKGRDFENYEVKTTKIEDLPNLRLGGDIGISNPITDLLGPKGFRPFTESNFFNKIEKLLIVICCYNTIADFLYIDLLKDEESYKIIQDDYTNGMNHILDDYRNGILFTEMKNKNGNYLNIKFGRDSNRHQIHLKIIKKGLVFTKLRSIVTGKKYFESEYFPKFIKWINDCSKLKGNYPPKPKEEYSKEESIKVMDDLLIFEETIIPNTLEKDIKRLIKKYGLDAIKSNLEQNL